MATDITIGSTPTPQPTTGADRARRGQPSRRQRAGVVAAVVLAVLIGGVIAARVEPTRSAAPTLPATLPTTLPPAIPPPTSPPSTALPSTAAPPVASIQAPRPDPAAVSAEVPTLVTTDGLGGFVGVLSPNRQDSRTSVFVRSSNGVHWFEVSQWTLNRHDYVTRIERHQGRYFAWIENGLTESSWLRVGVSDDLTNWQTLSIELVAPEPYSMTFDYSIAAVAVNGLDVLAMVTLDIELDSAALSRGENVGQLSWSAVTTLPPRTALFVSEAGAPFEPVSVPFGPDTTAQLSSIEGRFSLADETGVPFATSVDGVTWESVTGSGLVAYSVNAIATNDHGQTVGIGTVGIGAGGIGGPSPTLLFAVDGPASHVTPVVDLIGEEPNDYTTTVASGVAGWVITLEQTQGSAWILYSPDGLAWHVVDTNAGPIPARQVLVGDHEILVRSRGASSPYLVITL